MKDATGAEPPRGVGRLPSLLSDERLARRAAAGDQRAFAAIYGRYQQDLYRFCLAIVGNAADAQDALQNTMVQALRALPGEQREIKLKPWLYRVARNEAINVIRRRDAAQEQAELPATAEDVAGTAERREQLRRLLADLDQLPERQREAIVMRELAGFEFAEIGEAFATSAAVARQTVYEARLGLREMEGGRDLSCNEVTEAISAEDRRVLRRRDLRAHLRGCSDCRSFREAIEGRRTGFASLAPLPAAAAAAVLHGALSGSGAGGGAVAGAGAGAGAGGVGTAAGTAAVSSVVAKSVATIAIVAAGVAIADRTGTIGPAAGDGHGVSSVATHGAQAGEGGGGQGGGSPGNGSDAATAGGGQAGTHVHDARAHQGPGTEAGTDPGSGASPANGDSPGTAAEGTDGHEDGGSSDREAGGEGDGSTAKEDSGSSGSQGEGSERGDEPAGGSGEPQDKEDAQGEQGAKEKHENNGQGGGSGHGNEQGNGQGGVHGNEQGNGGGNGHGNGGSNEQGNGGGNGQGNGQGNEQGSGGGGQGEGHPEHPEHPEHPSHSEAQPETERNSEVAPDTEPGQTFKPPKSHPGKG